MLLEGLQSTFDVDVAFPFSEKVELPQNFANYLSLLTYSAFHLLFSTPNVEETVV